MIAAISYDGHPDMLHNLIKDNLARCHLATSTHEIAERVRAHCEFIATSVAIHTTLAGKGRAAVRDHAATVARVRAQHPEWDNVPNDLG